MISSTLTRVRDSQTVNRLLASSTMVAGIQRPQLTGLIEEESVQQALSKETAEAVELCFDEDFGQQFHSRIPVEDTAALNYLNRAYVDARQTLWVAGIRFRKLDRNQAFIGLSAPVFSRAPNDDEVRNFRTLIEDYKNFGVKRVQVLCLSSWPNELEIHQGLKWTTDKWIVAGRVETIAQAATDSTLELRPPKDDSYLERYTQAYDELELTRPQIASLLSREDKDSFGDCLSAELLFEVYYNDEWAGLIAAEPSELFGTNGYLIREEILSGKMRGKGLGPKMQAALAAKLAKRGDALLHGTIHAGNQPSLLTALRAGRKIIGCYGFWNQSF